VISGLLREYPNVSKAGWMSPELVIVLFSVGWAYVLGWIVIAMVSKDPDERNYDEEDGDE
jgi:hypothetical protein